MDAIEGRNEEEEKERLTLGFLPDEIKADCKMFLHERDVYDPQPYSLFLGISDIRVSHMS